MTAQDFRRWINGIKVKVQLIIGRCILKAISDSEGTQKIQVTGLKGETISDMERFEEYGLATKPETDAEVLSLFINGNRDHGIAICVHDRRYRPKDLNDGEVCLYDKNDNRITIVSTGIKLLAGTESFVKGDTAKTQFEVDRDRMQELQTAINGWVPVPMDGGAALKTALATWIGKAMADYSDILSLKIKGE